MKWLRLWTLRLGDSVRCALRTFRGLHGAKSGSFRGREMQGLTACARLATKLFQAELGGETQEYVGEELCARPAGLAPCGFDNSGGRRATGPVGARDEQYRVVALCSAGQTQPAGLDTSPTGYRWVTQVDDDQGKTTGKQHLGPDHGLFEALGTDPQEMLENDSCSSGKSRIETVSQVDQGRGFGGSGGRGEGREDDREAAAGTATDELDQLTARKPPFEQAVENLYRGRERGGGLCLGRPSIDLTGGPETPSKGLRKGLHDGSWQRGRHMPTIGISKA